MRKPRSEDIPGIIKKAYQDASKSSNAVSGFAKTGIYLLSTNMPDRSVFADEDFTPEPPEENSEVAGSSVDPPGNDPDDQDGNGGNGFRGAQDIEDRVFQETAEDELSNNESNDELSPNSPIVCPSQEYGLDGSIDSDTGGISDTDYHVYGPLASNNVSSEISDDESSAVQTSSPNANFTPNHEENSDQQHHFSPECSTGTATNFSSSITLGDMPTAAPEVSDPSTFQAASLDKPVQAKRPMVDYGSSSEDELELPQEPFEDAGDHIFTASDETVGMNREVEMLVGTRGLKSKPVDRSAFEISPWDLVKTPELEPKKKRKARAKQHSELMTSEENFQKLKIKEKAKRKKTSSDSEERRLTRNFAKSQQRNLRSGKNV